MSLTVVVCCYTDRRRPLLDRAIASARTQLGNTDRLIVVVDHNPDLLADLTATYRSAPEVTVVPNVGVQGLSDARNSGVAEASGDVVVFVDDDAALRPDALEALRRRFVDEDVSCVGGAVEAEWAAGRPPAWFPDEFGWVVGCDYRGIADNGADIRNPIGAAMAVRRNYIHEIGGFSPHLGRRGTFPAGCEETLMGISLREHHPGTRIVRDTDFAVRHSVPSDRARLRYFLRRCYQEGRSKAVLSRLTTTGNALASERLYTTRVLPSGVWRHRRKPGRVIALSAGFLVTCTGFAAGRLTVGKDLA